MLSIKSSTSILRNKTKPLSSFLKRCFGIKGGEKIKPLSKDVVEVGRECSQKSEAIISELAKKSRCDEDLFKKSLTGIINEGIEQNPNLKEKRLQYLNQVDDGDIYFIKNIAYIGIEQPKKAAFILDNAETINQIIKEKHLDNCYYYIDFLESINEKTYPTLLELAKNPKVNEEELISHVMYMAKEHTVGFGEDTVKVPTQEILSLLTGIPAPSCVISKSYETFNQMTQSLVAKGHKCKNHPYMEIAEGIITQRPDLIEMSEKHVKLINKLMKMNTIDVKKDPEKFYEVIGRYFPKEIELKTIIPDNNALQPPSHTVAAYKYFHQK